MTGSSKIVAVALSLLALSGGACLSSADSKPIAAGKGAEAAISPMAVETKPVKQPQSAKEKGEAKDSTFDDIKLEMKKGDPYNASLLTEKVKGLNGRTIRIRGYILPSFQQTGIKQFVLVRDNMECCFGPGALLHDCILVEMIDPATATFTVRPVSVEGAFSIREVLGPDGKHLAIYHLDGKEVK